MKYNDQITRALHGETADDTTGDVDGFGYHVSLYLVEDTEWTYVPEYGTTVEVPAGTYHVITEDNDGNVVRTSHLTAYDAQEDFDHWVDRYGAYLDESDTREHAITSSTGRVGR